MVRNLQGGASRGGGKASGKAGYGPSKGGPKGGYSAGGSAGSPTDYEGVLPTHLMGEAGRDHLLKYFTDSQLARKVVEAMAEDGYCVLPQVFTSQEMDVELDRAWDFIERVSPTVRRQDWNTWWASSGSPDPWPHSDAVASGGLGLHGVT